MCRCKQGLLYDKCHLGWGWKQGPDKLLHCDSVTLRPTTLFRGSVVMLTSLSAQYNIWLISSFLPKVTYLKTGVCYSFSWIQEVRGGGGGFWQLRLRWRKWISQIRLFGNCLLLPSCWRRCLFVQSFSFNSKTVVIWTLYRCRK